MTTTTTIVLIGIKSTVQVLNGDSGAGEIDPKKVFVAATAAFAPGDAVWLTDDASNGEAGVIATITLNTSLNLVDDLAGLFEVAENAQVVLAAVVSDYVLDIDTWRDRQSDIGTCKIKLDNSADAWGATFTPDDAIIISVNGSIIWQGLVDNVKPVLPVRAVVLNQLMISGRDYGRYLVDYTIFDYTKKDTAAATIIDEILALAEIGDPLLYTAPGGSPTITVSFKNIKLGDAIRKVCELSGWDFYIDNNRRLQFIDAGSVDSGVDLTMTGISTDTLLTFEELEQVGVSIKNFIKVSGGPADDHYTEDKAGWQTAGAAAAADDTTIVVKGDKSIKMTINAAGVSQIFLDFSGGLFSYSPTVDLSDINEAKVVFRGTIAGGPTAFSLRPYLVDDNGNKIVFARTGKDPILGGTTTSKGTTEQVGVDDWNAISYPIGEHTNNEIKPLGGALRNGFWTYTIKPGAPDFDWGAVEIMGFEWPHANNGEVLIDWWFIPSLDAISIAQDAASITAYGKRVKYAYKRQLDSQEKLDDFSADTLAFMKDPFQKFKGVTRGQVGSLYAALVVDVDVPSYGINDDPYIISALHHRLHKTKTTRGWDYTTDYQLAASDVPATMVVVEDNPIKTTLEKIRENNTGFQGTLSQVDVAIGDISSGHFTQETRGTVFPIIAADGDLHWLSADFNDAGTGFQYYGVTVGLLYTFDESVPQWIRPPANLGERAGDPPAGLGGGEYTGDRYTKTTDNNSRWEWTGAAWERVATIVLDDMTGEVSAGQLKKGIQPFDSVVLFEAIRAAATDAVTFDVDVNNGAGASIITASAGTPFSDFTAGDIVIIQNSEDSDHDTTGKVILAVNGGGAGIGLIGILPGVDNTDDETMVVSASDAIKWTGAAPAVWFADGGNQNINSADENGMANGAWYVYFTAGNANLTATQTYANAVGNTVGLICRVEITADQEPLIFPFLSRGANMSLDALAAGSVDTLVLTGEALIGKIMKSSAGVEFADGVGDAGTIMTRRGIKGKDAGGVTQFSLQSSDGKVLAGAGAVVLDEGGLTITSADDTVYTLFKIGAVEKGRIYTNNPIGDDEFYIEAELADLILRSVDNDVFIDAADELFLDSVNGTFLTGALIDLSTAGDITLDPGGDVEIDSADVIPIGATGKVGTAVAPFDEMHADDFFGIFRGFHVGPVVFEDSLVDDHTTSGIEIQDMIQGTVNFGDFLYLDEVGANGQWTKSDADAAATMPIGAMAMGTFTNEPGIMLIYGMARDNTWTWTPGALLYASTTLARLQETKPVGSGDVVQVVAQALTADIILFRPCLWTEVIP